MTKQESMALNIIAKHAIVPKHEITSESSLAAIGIDSLKFIASLLEIQRAIGREILTVEIIGNIKTVGDVLSITHPTASEH
jgi:acyl carrier protein